MTLSITNGRDERFVELCSRLDSFLNDAVGCKKQRESYNQYNTLGEIHDVVIMLQDDIPIGCGALKEYAAETAEIKRVFVAPEWRGQGVGRRLMEALEALAAEKGYCSLVLETGRHLAGALGLYRSLGFCETENYGPYADMPDSICMRKELL